MLTEYIEEFPLLLNRPGMASRVLAYATRVDDSAPPLELNGAMPGGLAA